ncbi:MAG: hypothetical protein ACE5NG_06520 [bacterium]
MKKVILGLIFLATVCSAKNLVAVETRLVVRVKSKDAKFVGTSMGGALVIIKNSESGEIITKGFTRGGTGNTAKIMKEPIKRGARLSDDSTAKFEAHLDLDEPILVTIEAYAPYAQRQSMVRSSTQAWLIPGKDIVGDGVILEVAGFAVDVLLPQTHERIKLRKNKATIPIKANIVMM